MEEQRAKSNVKDAQRNDIKRQWSFMNKLSSKSTRENVKSRACKSVFYQPVDTEGNLTNENKNDLDNTIRSEGEEQPSRNCEAEEHKVSLSMQNGVTDGQPNDVPVKRSMVKKAKSTKWTTDNLKTELPNTTSKSVFYHPVVSEDLITNVDKNDLDNTVRCDGEEQPTKSLQKEEHNVSIQNDDRDGQPNNVLKQRSMITKPKSKNVSVNHPKTDDVKSPLFSDKVCKSVFYHPVDAEGSNEDRTDLHNTIRCDGKEHPTQSSEKEEHNVPLSTQRNLKDGERSDISLPQFMLNKLQRKGSDDHPKTDDVKSHAIQDRAGIGVHSVEPGGCLTSEDKNDLDNTIKPDGDAEQPNSQTEDGNVVVEEFTGLTNEIPMWERKSFSPVLMPLETQVGKPEKDKTLEVKNNNEPIVKEHMAEDALFLDCPSQQSSAQESDLAMSKNKPLDEACGGPLTPVNTDASSLQTHQTTVNVSIREIRSASDPVAQKTREERSLSDPSVSNLHEYEKYAKKMTLKSFGKAAMVLGWGNSGMAEHENSLAKMEKKGGKRGMKYYTHKLMGMLKEKQDCEQTDSKNTQESGQEELQSLSSVQMEAEIPEIPPPLPPKQGKCVTFTRKFTLKDFKLDLEPIDLMGEIFTGEEWLSYLPSKTSPEEKESVNQSKPYQTNNDSKLNDLQPIPEQDQSEDMNDNRDSVNDDQQDNVAKVNESLPKPEESEAKFFAIPKALLTNNAKPLETDCDKSDDIYDSVDMYIIPKNECPVINRKSSDISALDFVTVKSCALLDNSALKSRIRVSKKRCHRPPKQQQAGKEISNAKFYNVPPTILNTSPVSACLPRPSIPLSTSPLHLPPHP